jgi:hypothetical protein
MQSGLVVVKPYPYAPWVLTISEEIKGALRCSLGGALSTSCGNPEISDKPELKRKFNVID